LPEAYVAPNQDGTVGTPNGPSTGGPSGLEKPTSTYPPTPGGENGDKPPPLKITLKPSTDADLEQLAFTWEIIGEENGEFHV